MMRFWQRYQKRIRESKVSPLLRFTVWGILAFLFLRLWRGNPDTIRFVQTDASSFLFESLYFCGLYLLIFSYSRTLSIQASVRWFYLGMVGMTTAFGLLHLWIYTVGPAAAQHPLFGFWSDKQSVYHSCIFSPLLSEGLKTLPLLIFLWVARRRKTLASYSISDWALMGFLVGTGFYFAENTLRMRKFFYGVDLSWPKGAIEWFIPIWRSRGTFEAFGRTFQEINGPHAYPANSAGYGRMMSTYPGGTYVSSP